MGTTLTDPVHGEMEAESRSIRVFYGTPRTYRFEYQIFVKVDGTPFGKPGSAMEGEILGMTDEPRCVRIHWEDGSVSESVEMGPRHSWNYPEDTGIPFRLDSFADRTIVRPGTNWFPSHFWYDAAACVIFAIPFTLPLVIATVFITQKPLWRLGPIPRKCPLCKYDLRHLDTTGCPECGWGRRRASTTS